MIPMNTYHIVYLFGADTQFYVMDNIRIEATIQCIQHSQSDFQSTQLLKLVYNNIL